MSFAFPVLKNDTNWQAYIAEVNDEVAPSSEEHTDIIVAAMRMSGRLKKGTRRMKHYRQYESIWFRPSGTGSPLRN
jgi:hypothetical protein